MTTTSVRKLFIYLCFPTLFLFFACGPGILGDDDAIGPDGTELIYHENFTNKRNDWLRTNDPMYRTWISEGKYHFDNYHETDSGYLSVVQQRISESDNFSIETTVDFVQGVDTLTNFGLVFGHHYDLNCGYKFLISADGHFEIAEEYYAQYGVICPPTYTEFLKTGTETNYLRVNKTDSLLKFLVNGHQVFDLPFDSLYGNWVGYQVYNDIEVQFDDMKIFN